MFQSVIAVLSLLVATAASGAGPDEQRAREELRGLERSIEAERGEQRNRESAARELAREVRKLQQAMVGAARAVHDQEQAVGDIEAELAALDRRMAALAADLASRREQLANTLAALQRLALQPPEAMAVMPTDPLDTVRGATLLRGIVPALERAAIELRGTLEEMAPILDSTRQKRQALQSATDRLDARRSELAALVARKQVERDAAGERAREMASRIAQLADEAKDLKELLERLVADREAEAKRQAKAERQAEAERRRAAPRQAEQAKRQPDRDRAPEPVPSELAPSDSMIASFSQARGRVHAPVTGQIVERYGQGTGAGGARRGVTLTTRALAQVVAPYDGKVVYAGPFRGYGLLLIIEHSDDYHSLLMGLSRLTASPGQILLAGEPVGIMGAADSGELRLYMELRHHGQPINPLPWLAAQKG
ncbi:MAG: peptidase M23 [Alphaproteobacteria bacterium]|nr:peptidase M23 [Alphaproteobacteria bacterium]